MGPKIEESTFTSRSCCSSCLLWRTERQGAIWITRHHQDWKTRIATRPRTEEVLKGGLKDTAGEPKLPGKIGSIRTHTHTHKKKDHMDEDVNFALSLVPTLKITTRFSEDGSKNSNNECP
jgi:hypothetical protein